MRSFQPFLFACCALLLGLAQPAQAQRAVWQQSQMGGQYRVDAQLLATDAAGNSYITGGFRDSLRLPGTTLYSVTPAHWDGFVAKYNAAGRQVWLQTFGGAADEIPIAVAVDASLGAVYVSGQHGRACRWDAAHVLDSAGTYLARLDAATGAIQWVRSVDDPTARPAPSSIRSIRIEALTVAPDHTLYLGGAATGVDALDGLPLHNFQPYTGCGLVAHCTPTGTFTDVFELIGGSYSMISRVAVDATNGNVVASGNFAGTVQFGLAAGAPQYTSNTPSPGSTQFVARLTAAGSAVWVTRATFASHGDITSMTLDAQGNCYAAGRNYQSLTFDQTVAADTGQYVVRLSPQGGVQWLKTFPGNEPNNYVTSMTVGADGLLYSTGLFYAIRLSTYTATYDAFTLRTFGITNLFVLCQDPATGTVRWAKTRDQISGGGSNNIGLAISTDAQNNVYVMGWNDAPGTYDGNEVGSYGSFMLRLDPSAFLGGQVYLDANGNGLRDAGEGAFPRPVQVREGQRAEVYSTNPTGSYNAFVSPGPYALDLAALPTYYEVSAPNPASYQGTLANNGSRVDNLNFGLRALANRPDLRVTLTPYSRARPGQVLRYRVRVENVGTTTIASGQVSVTLDPAATIIGTVPAAAISQGQTRAWGFANLAPFQLRDFDVSFSLAVTIPLNTPVTSVASVTPVVGDFNPADNTDEVQQSVSNSVDPNDLVVNHAVLTPSQVSAATPLDYTIRFENVGNDTAYALVIQDTLPAGLLQLGTMRLVSQSHNCEWQVVGRVLKARFPNIVLPHQAVDAIRSKGFIRFRVVPNTTLGLGTLIPNTAHITFDFNLPLATNQATTLVQGPTGVGAEAAAATWALYPNPATTADAVLLTADVPTAGPATVRVLDALGRTVRSETVEAPAGTLRHPVDATGLTPGLYVVQLTLPGTPPTAHRLLVRGR